MVKVLFICTGNICRSPTAEGVFRALIQAAGLEAHIQTDSAGTHDYHVGHPPDSRSVAAALLRGVDLRGLRARRVAPEDFEEFDLLVAMDPTHYRILESLCPIEHRHKLALFMDFAPQFARRDVPDPYYGDGDGFEMVLDMIEAGAQGILERVQPSPLPQACR